MQEAAERNDDVATIIRWVARIIALFIAGFVAIFASGEGISFRDMTSSELVLAIVFALMWIGLLVGWRSDFWGGLMLTGGTLLYLLLDFLFHGSVLRFWLYMVFLIPGILLLCCWWRGRHPA